MVPMFITPAPGLKGPVSFHVRHLSMNLDLTASRLEGYFSAVAALKDDGTTFTCIGVKDRDFLSAWSAAAQVFGLIENEFSVVPLQLVGTNLPESLEHWILNRIRPMSQADEAALDNRLIHGLCDELMDIFRSAPRWFEVHVSTAPTVMHSPGGIWTIYLFGTQEQTYALRCSWDS